MYVQDAAALIDLTPCTSWHISAVINLESI